MWLWESWVCVWEGMLLEVIVVEPPVPSSVLPVLDAVLPIGNSPRMSGVVAPTSAVNAA